MMQLNHTIVYCSDQTRSSRFLVEVFGRPDAVRYGPFRVVTLDNDVSLDYMQASGAIRPQHYAFLVSEEEFDAAFARLKERKSRFWADPMQAREGEINRHDGGRGVYFEDPDGHVLEMITVPYGGKP